VYATAGNVKITSSAFENVNYGNYDNSPYHSAGITMGNMAESLEIYNSAFTWQNSAIIFRI
jgi:hypothetical protein